MLNLNIKNTSNPYEDFKRIASDLMNNCLLQVSEDSFRIMDIEFYYYSELHKDPYSHKNQKQLTSNEWYFHGSGLDITFGNGESFGGILIREIQEMNTNNYFSGPIVSVSRILSSIKQLEIRELKFGLIKNNNPFSSDLFQAPRIGLNKAHDEDYHSRPYRFLVEPKKPHKEKSRIIETTMNLRNTSLKDAQEIIYN
ncbi:hypothetical protein [Roseivirga echinicomitans]|uniref:Uncharacterized protein n=1 Tax=Roseivirga echinicomitans TaxID=296218 RepID=A0A150XEI1_9BACT|nr:hypothetical protein [Roseivirga echinicomitans]KYG77159.1 hypothetical protein AWN68_18170 [Roseivirga echinicomitans]